MADCIPVKGANRSCIYDLGRGKHYLIPNLLCEVLSQKFGNKVEDIAHVLGELTFNEYFSFLEKNEIIQFLDEDELRFWPKLSLEFDSIGPISNCIIELNDNQITKRLIKQITSLGCRHVELRILGNKTKAKINNILASFEHSGITTISLNLINTGISETECLFLENSDVRISQINIIEEAGNEKFSQGEGTVNFLVGVPIWGEEDTHISPNNFFVNMQFFIEAYNKNIAYNGKLFLLVDGQIYVSKKGKPVGTWNGAGLNWNETRFKKEVSLWEISKDKVAVCKDCEFRYMCYDQRIPRKIRNSEYYTYDNDCNYNPYISKWEQEDGYVSLRKSGVHIADGKIKKNHHLIRKINKEIWDE